MTKSIEQKRRGAQPLVPTIRDMFWPRQEPRPEEHRVYSISIPVWVRKVNINDSCHDLPASVTSHRCAQGGWKTLNHGRDGNHREAQKHD